MKRSNNLFLCCYLSEGVAQRVTEYAHIGQCASVQLHDKACCVAAVLIGQRVVRNGNKTRIKINCSERIGLEGRVAEQFEVRLCGTVQVDEQSAGTLRGAAVPSLALLAGRRIEPEGIGGRAEEEGREKKPKEEEKKEEKQNEQEKSSNETGGPFSFPR